MRSLDTYNPEEAEKVFRETVARGGPWLDEYYPEWRERVNPETVKMVSSTECMLSQASGTTYKDAAAEHGLTFDDLCDLGFNVPTAFLSIRYYTLLKEEWIRQYFS